MITTGINKRVQVQQIVDSQIPEFFLSESPNYPEFLKQYYISQEYTGGPVDLADNLDQYLKLDNLTPEVIKGETTLTGITTVGAKTISVESTKGFPDKYGLLKIDNEIITYTGLTTNTFTGCERGFSGISTYHEPNNPGELVFSDTVASEHAENATVKNLSALFLQEFYKKLKYTLTPGMENSKFVDKLDVNNFIKEARTFYETKGTEESFRILFNVLYGVDPSVIDLEDYLIKPSSAKYIRREEVVAELISGDPLKLKGQTIVKSTDSQTTASVSDVEYLTGVNVGNYYRLDLFVGYNERDSITGTFTIPGKTKVIGDVDKDSDVITVDSTVGFSTTGTLIHSGINTNITYTDTTINQFLNCKNIKEKIDSTDNLRSDEVIFGYENGNLENKVELRITGVLSKFTPADTNKLCIEGESIYVDTLGDLIDNPDINKTKKEVFANSWIYNTSATYETDVFVEKIVGGINTSAKITQFNVLSDIDKSSLKVTDAIDILEKNASGITTFVVGTDVVDAISNNNVELRVGFDAYVGKNYSIRRSLNKTSSTYIPITYGNNEITSDIQNVYNDSDKNLYVASNSLPSYPIQSKILQVGITTITANDTVQGQNTTNFKYSILSFANDVPFITGDEVYYQPGTTPLIGLSAGNYYVRVLNEKNKIRLYLSPAFIESDSYIEFDIPVSTTTHTFTLLRHLNAKIGPQKLLRKYPLVPNLKDSKDVKTIPGTTGMLVNGVEISNYKSTDNIFYGPIDEFLVLNGGSNYDLVNLPKITISSGLGTTALVQPVVRGDIVDIIIDEQNFDIEDINSITMSGGNGAESILQPIIKKRFREISFDGRTNDKGGGIDITAETITFLTPHNLRNGQGLVYDKNNNSSAIGIGTFGASNAYLNNFLTEEAVYYPQVVGINTIRLYGNIDDYAAGINTIGFTFAGKSGIHKFRLAEAKKTLDSVDIIKSGNPYENRRIFVKQAGINTFRSTIKFEDHGFSSGELITYSSSGSLISGLSQSNQYYVIKLDNDTFRLSNAGVGGTIKTEYLDNKYVNLKSKGTDYQEFAYPPLTININAFKSGISTDSTTKLITPTEDFVATPIARGEIVSGLLYEKGTGYGSTDVINFKNKPIISLQNGKGGALRPIISNGKIIKVVIESSGSEYYSPPDLEVAGDGFSGQLRAVITDNKITDVKIISSGISYTQDKTTIKVKSVGLNVLFDTNIRELTLNNFERFNKDNELLLSSPNNLKYSIVGYSTDIWFKNKNVNSSLEKYFVDQDAGGGHSKIIGWAYDGNPIYGPYGYSDALDPQSNIRVLNSGYSLNTDYDDRPIANDGLFVNDYLFTGSGDLDEHNGRFCKTPDYPDGIYAYFVGLSTNASNYFKPQFPYFIGNSYRSNPLVIEDQNVFTSDQSLFNYNESGLIRNTFPYKISNEFADNDFIVESNEIQSQITIVDSVTQGSVQEFDILNSGDSYKIGDNLVFDNTGTTGNGVNAVVSILEGKTITEIDTSIVKYDDVVFVWSSPETVSAYISTSHILSDKNPVTISGLSTAINYLADSHIVGVPTETTILYKQVESNTTLSQIEDIFVGRTNLISIGSSIGIGTEKLHVLNKFEDRNILRVKRGISGTAHTISTIVSLIPSYFDIPLKTDQFTSKVNHIVYFNPKQSVGIATIAGISTSIDVTVGVLTESIDVPAQSLYLPNHTFITGQKVKFNTNPSGTNIAVSTDGNIGGSGPTSIANGDEVFIINKGDNYIGIVTQVGLTTTNGLFFTGNASNYYDYSFESTFDQITGSVERITTQVSVSTEHNLSNGDIVNLSVKPNQTVGIGSTNATIPLKVKFNALSEKLLVNNIGFTSAGVNTTTNIIGIFTHGLNTGDKVYYDSPDGDIISGLETGGYFVYKIDNNRIQLSDTLSRSKSIPPEVVSLVSIGGSNHELSLINPPLNVIRNNNLIFDISDSSLSGYEFKFYYDREFKNGFVSTGQTDSTSITRNGTIGVSTDATITLNYSGYNPLNLYYNIEKSGFISTSDVDVEKGSQISYRNSEYNGDYSVSGIGSTTFNISLNKIPESFKYLSTNTETLHYTTKSLTARGGISGIGMNFGGIGYKQLPAFVSIASTEGSGAIILPTSKTTNNIDTVNIMDIGFEYASDKTLAPSAKLSPVVTLTKNNKIIDVKIDNGGKNYISPPKIVVIDSDTREIVNSDYLEPIIGSSKSAIVDVTVRSEVKGIGVVELYTIDNSNGIDITNISVGSTIITDSITGIATFTLKTPPLVGFSTLPFKVGDKFFVEGIVNEYGNGFNSADNDYKFYTIKSIPSSNPLKIECDLNGIASNPGLAKTDQEFGTVIPFDWYPKFNPTIVEAEFMEDEVVLLFTNDYYSDIGLSVDKVANNYVKLLGNYNLKVGDIIKGSISGSIATINSTYRNSGTYTVDYSSRQNQGWIDGVGKLDEDYQVIPDNDYYQTLSYTVKSPIEYQSLVNSVNRLVHTTGLKNFADVGIGTTIPTGSASIGSTDATIVTRDLISETRVDTINNFDNVVDVGTLLPNKGNKIRLKTVRLTDYILCKSNRVLKVDDISSQFSNVSSNVGIQGGPSTAELDLNASYNRLLIQAINPATSDIQISEALVSIDFISGDVFTIDKGSLSNSNIDNNQSLLDYIGEKEVDNTYRLKISPVDPFDTDVNIKILQDSFVSSVGLTSTSLGFVDLIGTNDTVAASTTSVIASAEITKLDSYFASVEIKDTFADETNIVDVYVTHDGTNSYIADYNLDILNSNFIGTFTSNIESGILYLNYENKNTNQVSVNSKIVGFGTTASGVGTYRFKESVVPDGSENSARFESSYSNVSSASTIFEFTKSKVTTVKNIVRVSVGQTSALHQILIAHNNVNTYDLQYPFISIGSTSGIGTFGSTLVGSKFNLNFYPDTAFSGGGNMQVQNYSEVLYTALDFDNAAPNLTYGSVKESLSLLQYTGYASTSSNSDAFDLKYNRIPIFEKVFNPGTVISDLSIGEFYIPNHFFSDNERVTYTANSTIEGVSASSMVMGNGEVLPSQVYIKKINNSIIGIATVSAGTAVTFTSVGAGNAHRFEMQKKLEKSIVALDDIIQTPLSYTPVTTTLANNVSSSVSISTSIISLSGISTFETGQTLKIDDEYVKITNIGIGSTNIGPITNTGSIKLIEVERGFVGSTAATHSDGATVRLYNGGFNIERNKIYFTEVPAGQNYEGISPGNYPPHNANFNGNVYLRQNYSTNAIYDDISDKFTGIGQTFDVTIGASNTTGITTGSSLVVINGIFQKPTTENNSNNNYSFIGGSNTGITSYVFTGISSDNGAIIKSEIDVVQNQLPRSGQVVSFASEGGLGIAPLVGASVTAVIGAGGSIVSVGLGTQDLFGSGYRFDGSIAIGITDVGYDHKFVSVGVNSITVAGNGIGAASAVFNGITDATYTPIDGKLTLIKPAHNLITSDNYTATTGTVYDPNVGILTVKLSSSPSPALANGQLVKFDDYGLKFKCAMDSNATTHPYPRPTDPLSGKWLPISNVTGGDQFEINVLASAPSSNTSVHTFDSSVADSVKRSANTVGIVTDGIVFTCSDDGYNSNNPYPRTTDPAHNATLSIIEATSDTISVGVGSGGGAGRDAVITASIAPYNIHKFVSATSSGLSVTGGSGATLTANNAQYDPRTGILTVTTSVAHGMSAAGIQTATTGTVYNPTSGIMTVTTLSNHGYSNSDYVKIADNSLTFTCAKDGHVTNHTYPRSTDPISNKWIQISNVTSNTFQIQVLDSTPSTNTSAHTYVSASAAGIQKANSTVGIGTSSLTFTCAQDNHTSNHAYPRPYNDDSHNATLGVEGIVDTTNFTVNVGKSPAGTGGALQFTVGTAGTGYVNPKISCPQPFYENLEVIGVSRLGIGATTDTGKGLLLNVDIGASSTTGIGSTLFEVKSFTVPRSGFSFKRGDVIKPVGLVTDRYLQSPISDFTLTVDSIFTDSFGSWNVGEFDYIDSTREIQDGSRTAFPLKVNGELLSFQTDRDDLDSQDIDLKSVLLIFINGVIQVPDVAYTFNGGTVVNFLEAPDPADDVAIFFYRGSSIDSFIVDVPETLKDGDLVKVNQQNTPYPDPNGALKNNFVEQEQRTITGITTSDEFSTNLYYGLGMNRTNYVQGDFRPMDWIKQKTDKVIGGEVVYKTRNVLETLVFPNAGITSGITTNTTEFFVDSVDLFNYEGEAVLDFECDALIVSQVTPVAAAFTATVSTAGTISAVTITNPGSGYTVAPTLSISNPPVQISTGIGTTATVSAVIGVGGTITSISITNPGLGYSETNPPQTIAPLPKTSRESITGISATTGFSGIITGITTTSGTGSNPLALKFFGQRTSGSAANTLLNSYPVVIYNTEVGTGCTSITGTGATVGIGTTFLDNIYHVSSFSNPGSLNAFEFISNIDSNSPVTGINTYVQGLSGSIGEISWGRLSGATRSGINPISVEVAGFTVNSGLTTFPYIQRRNAGLRTTGAIEK